MPQLLLLENFCDIFKHLSYSFEGYFWMSGITFLSNDMLTVKFFA